VAQRVAGEPHPWWSVLSSDSSRAVLGMARSTHIHTPDAHYLVRAQPAPPGSVLQCVVGGTTAPRLPRLWVLQESGEKTVVLRVESSQELLVLEQAAIQLQLPCYLVRRTWQVHSWHSAQL
jgi:hypothetical protein